MSSDGLIGAWDIDGPDGWFAFPAEPPPGWSDELAAMICGDHRRRPAMAAHLARMYAELRADEGWWLGFGVWVPEADNPWIAGGFGAQVIVSEAGEDFSPASLRQVMAVRSPAGITIHQREVAEIELPAGPALRYAEIVSDDDTGDIEERIEYTVFPPSAIEAIQVSFVSPKLQWGERLATESAAIVESMWVRLGRDS
ncbi:MAG: hypothetical protein ACRCYQ_15155 [Nocardioides sp.]